MRAHLITQTGKSLGNLGYQARPTPMADAPTSPIAKVKVRKFTSPTTMTNAVARFQSKGCNKVTEAFLAYTWNPTTQQWTTNMKLGIRLKQSISNPKGFVEEAWASPSLCEKPWSYREPTPRTHVPRSLLILAIYACAGSTTVRTGSR